MYRAHAIFQKSIAATAASTVWLFGMACMLCCLSGVCHLPISAGDTLAATLQGSCKVPQSAPQVGFDSACSSTIEKKNARKSHPCCHAKKSAQVQAQPIAKTQPAPNAPPPSKTYITQNHSQECFLKCETTTRYLTATAPRIEPDQTAAVPVRALVSVGRQFEQRSKFPSHSLYRQNRSGTYLRCCVFLI